MTSNTKNFITIFVIAILIAVTGTWAYKKIQTANGILYSEQPKSLPLCFYKELKGPSGLSDRTWLRLQVEDMKATGELRIYPAEKDSKVGGFDGLVEIDEKNMSGSVKAWWDVMAEGTRVTEELIFKFDTQKAEIAFGEMKDRGDGFYVYKDKENIFYSMSLDKKDCEDLNQILRKEGYIKD